GAAGNVSSATPTPRLLSDSSLIPLTDWSPITSRSAHELGCRVGLPLGPPRVGILALRFDARGGRTGRARSERDVPRADALLCLRWGDVGAARVVRGVRAHPRR